MSSCHFWFLSHRLLTFEGDSILFKLVALRRHCHSEWHKLCQQKRFSYTGSIKIHRSRRVPILTFGAHAHPAVAVRNRCRLYRRRWYQPLHRFILRKILALRRRRARLWTKSCVARERLVVGTERAVSIHQNFQVLGDVFPLLYMFGINCFGIEMVLYDLYLKTKDLLFWHFHEYCLVQIVSLWSLSIRVRIISTINDLVGRIRNFKSNASWFRRQIHRKKMRRRTDFFFLWTKYAAGKTYHRDPSACAQVKVPPF